MTYSVFVSSTFTDLERHRQLVLDAISKLEHGPMAMESFGARPDTPKEECLRLVRAANAYIGIFGMRYGSIDSASDKSLTQLEYEEAQALRLPSLIYLLDEENHLVFPRHVDTGSSAEKLRALKAQLQRAHVTNLFNSPEDLATRVTEDLVRLVGTLAEQPRAQVLAQLAATSVKRHPLTPPRFDYLKRRTAGIFEQNIPDSILREAFELVTAGDNMAAAFVLSRGTPMPLDDAVDGLMKVDEVFVDIVAEFSRKSGEQRDV